ncbi:MAG: LCP family protein [Candidatus Paceibacterota bacterium]|jgi:LCP family protein required for cell wall assembly
MLKIAVKFFFLMLLLALIPLVGFSYEFFQTGNKIFSKKEGSDSIIKQFSEMIFSPAQSLDGENEDSINILLLGIGGKHHNGGDLTDTIMIARIKPQKKEAAFISIPRDLFVHVTELNIGTKINAVKALGDKNGKDGMLLLKNTIEEISGQKINYYLQLDFSGFTKIIDDVGGIDIELENDINDPTYPNFSNGYDPFYIKKGLHHLDGALALKVARSRHSKMGDFDRIKRQQNILKAFRQKIFEKYSSVDIMAFKNILTDLGDHLQTDIEPKEIPRFYKIAKDIGNHKITTESIDTSNYLARSYVGLGYTLDTKSKDYENIKKFSEDIFTLSMSDEERDSIKKESATIEIKNATGTPDVANTVARDLESYGFRIINSTNTADETASGVKILNNSNGLKPLTLSILKSKFLAMLEDGADISDSKADFVILLGKGF